MDPRPTISIVSICFNNLNELKDTCRSVDEQTLAPTEHLVIDGSANSEILEWLTGTPQPAYRRWIHERDRGISDAFNKGVKNAKGAIIHLLNSGDRLAAPDVIARVMDEFATHPGTQWIHGAYIQHRGGIDVISGEPFRQDQLWKGMRTVAHPTMFLRRELYQRHGTYDLDLRVAMDYDLLTRIRREPFRYLSTPLVYFAPGGASQLQFHRGLAEVRQSHRRNIGRSGRQVLWQARQRLLHLVMRTRLGTWWFGLKNRGNRYGS